MRLRLRILDRYLIREILAPFGLGALVYTFILLIQFLFQSADLIIRRGLDAPTVGRLFLYILPSILVLTIPMALLFGILVAIGRLSAESELTAMRACGVSLLRLYRGVVLLSLLLTGITGFVSFYLLPRGNLAFANLQFEIVTKTVSQQVEPRQFVEAWPPFVLYVFDSDGRNRRWRGAFLADESAVGEQQVTVAASGGLTLDAEGERLVLELDEAYTHKVSPDAPDRYNLSFSTRSRQLLQDHFSSSQQARSRSTKGPRTMTLGELFAQARDPDTPFQLHNLTWVEIHKKFAFPAACLVFGLLALPLGITRRRGGKSSGFALSIAVILVYYVLLNAGEEAARVGDIPPWLAMWSPNLLLGLLGFALLRWRMNESGAGRSGFWRRLWRRRPVTAAPSSTPSPTRSAGSRSGGHHPKLVLRLPRLRLRFPNLLDRYVIRRFATFFLLAGISTAVLYVVGDLTENAKYLFGATVPARLVFDYYSYSILQIAFDIAPIAVLVAVLVTFSLLSRTQEVTAAKALGVSVYRLALPAVIAVAAVAVVCVALQLWVLPAANRKVGELNDRIRGGDAAARTYQRVDRQWALGQGRHIYNYQYFRPARGATPAELSRLQIFEFDEQYRLRRRLFADHAHHAENGWILDRGWYRDFTGTTVRDYRTFDTPQLVRLPEEPEYFQREVLPPEQMDYTELRRYLRDLRASGQPVPELEVALRQKIAFPVVTLVMAFVALPFAFRLGRAGALYGLGLAVVLSIVFYAVFAFFTTLGETGALPAMVAVWSPIFLFALLSSYLFLGVRT